MLLYWIYSRLHCITSHGTEFKTWTQYHIIHNMYNTCAKEYIQQTYETTKNITWNYSSPLIQPSIWKMLLEAEHLCSQQWDLLHSEHPQHFQLSLYQCSAIKMQIKDNSVTWHFFCSIDIPHRRQHAQQLILTLKPPTLKYHQCTVPKIRQECAKNYTRYFHIKTLSGCSETWHTVQYLLLGASSLHIYYWKQI